MRKEINSKWKAILEADNGGTQFAEDGSTL